MRDFEDAKTDAKDKDFFYDRLEDHLFDKEDYFNVELLNREKASKHHHRHDDEDLCELKRNMANLKSQEEKIMSQVEIQYDLFQKRTKVIF